MISIRVSLLVKSHQKTHSSVKYINNGLHLARKYARIFVLGHYLFREANSFPRARTVSFEEQIMSKCKYPSIISPQKGGYYVNYASNCFRNTRGLIFSSFSWGIFGHVTCLDQSRASENI